MWNLLFGWLTAFEPMIAIMFFSAFVMILINIPYKFLVDQEKVLEIKKKIKDLNKESRQAQKEGDTGKVKKIMSESMSLNSKMMKSTMKPMLFSFVIVIVLLPWIADTYGDVAVPAGDNTVMIDGIQVDISQYSIPEYGIKIQGHLWNVIMDGGNVKMQRIIAMLPVSLPLFGNDLGWLGWYFIMSIPLMIIIRKLMGINL